MVAASLRGARLNGDFLVILRAVGGGLATKRLFRVPGGFGVKSEPKVTEWRWERVPVAGLDDIEEALSRAAGDSAACVIGDDIREGAGPVIFRRIEGEDADLIERGRRWLAFDCDGWVPPGWPLSAAPTDADIRGAVRALVDTLPGLEGAECVYRLSATAGLVKRGDDVRVPGWASLRCHVWFWLDREVFPPSLKAWFKAHFPDGTKGSPGWDAGMMDRARVHYVASPVIEGGEVVAVNRIGRIEGRAAAAPVQWQSLEDWRDSEARVLADARARLAALKLEQAGRPRDGGDIEASVRRILASRVVANISGPATKNMKPVCDASEPGSETAHKGAVRALTNAKALEMLGEVGAVRDCEDMLRSALLSLGKSGGKSRGAAQAVERCIRRALVKVNPGEVAESVAGARAKYVPPKRTRNAFPDAMPANDIEPGGRAVASPALPVPAVALPGEEAGDPLPRDVAGLYGAFLWALERDPVTWPGEVIEALGGLDAAEDAVDIGAGVVGERARELLRSMAATNEGRAVLVDAGFVAAGRPWGPVARGTAPALVAPLFGPASSGPVGFASMVGEVIGEAWPVGLRWPCDGTLGRGRSSRPVVVVGEVLDALSLGALAFGLPGEDGKVLSLDVLAAQWPVDWAEVIEGRRAVLVATGGHVAAEVVAAARAAGVPVAMAGRVAGVLSWREAAARGCRRAIVERWRTKVREVLQ